MSAERLTAIYHIRDAADRVEARAKGIAVEQSVEMPVAAITDRACWTTSSARWKASATWAMARSKRASGFEVATTGLEAGQLVNMLFGNSSMHPDIVLADAEFPPSC